MTDIKLEIQNSKLGSKTKFVPREKHEQDLKKPNKEKNDDSRSSNSKM